MSTAASESVELAVHPDEPPLDDAPVDPSEPAPLLLPSPLPPTDASDVSPMPAFVDVPQA